MQRSVRVHRVIAIICFLAAGRMWHPQRSAAQQPAVAPLNGQAIADSKNDFSNQQGKGGWTYLYYIGNKDGTMSYVPDDARPMSWDVGKAGRKPLWTGPVQWYNHTETSSEPQVISGCFQGWTVRRWTSDRAGTLHIVGHANRASKEGDGVGIKVFVDGKELFSKLVAPASTADFDLRAAVNKGSRLDFVVTPGPTLDASFDSTAFHVTILGP